ncbi:hypothetical protein [Marinicella sp. W31]|uniref:hypothetical protein n=1 Tax=Marinicella sp. W31 TaxID=3023713 RepID=UPI003756E9C9
MKLKDSLTERSLKKSLQKSKEVLFSGETPYRKILLELQKEKFGLKSAYVLHYLPEQGEDIYTIITDSYEIVTIEFKRGSYTEAPIRKETISLDEYRKGLSRNDLIQLELATELLSNQGHP